MCTSIKDGGRRCKKHEAQAAKNKLKKAKESGNPEDIKAAKIEYLLTEEGIEQLEDAGKDELAEKFRGMRNRKTELHNAHWGTHLKLMAPRAVRRAPAYNIRGFDAKTNTHRDTGSLYDLKGWDIDGNHRDTHSQFDADGFNVIGTDAEGYGRDGFKNGYDRQGFNIHGFDRDGYLATGYHHKTMLDRDGYDAEGWSRFAINKATQQPYDADGYNRDGYHHLTGIGRESGMTALEEISTRYRSPQERPVSA